MKSDIQKKIDKANKIKEIKHPIDTLLISTIDGYKRIKNEDVLYKDEKVFNIYNELLLYQELYETMEKMISKYEIEFTDMETFKVEMSKLYAIQGKNDLPIDYTTNFYKIENNEVVYDQEAKDKYLKKVL